MDFPKISHVGEEKLENFVFSYRWNGPYFIKETGKTAGYYSFYSIPIVSFLNHETQKHGGQAVYPRNDFSEEEYQKLIKQERERMIAYFRSEDKNISYVDFCVANGWKRIPGGSRHEIEPINLKADQ